MITVPEPDPHRLHWLITRIRIVEAGQPRRPYIAELVEVLKPWINHWAGGFADAERRLSRVKALGHSVWGHEFADEEINIRLKAALLLLPPRLMRVVQ